MPRTARPLGDRLHCGRRRRGHGRMTRQGIGDACRQLETLGRRGPHAHSHIRVGAQGLRVHEHLAVQPSASILLASCIVVMHSEPPARQNSIIAAHLCNIAAGRYSA